MRIIAEGLIVPQKGNMMHRKELIEILRELLQVDVDAFHAYKQVIDQVSDDVVQSRLREFQEDHARHIKALSGQIASLNAEVPSFSRDFKGYLLKAFGAFGRTTGMKGALAALKITEGITTRYYGERVSADAPPALKTLLRQHFTDEKNHLEYIAENLKTL